MFTPLRQTQDTNNKQRTNVLWFLLRKLDSKCSNSLYSVFSCGTKEARFYSGSQTSKKGEERFYNYYNAVRLPICIVAIVHLKQCTIVGRALPIYL